MGLRRTLNHDARQLLEKLPEASTARGDLKARVVQYDLAEPTYQVIEGGTPHAAGRAEAPDLTLTIATTTWWRSSAAPVAEPGVHDRPPDAGRRAPRPAVVDLVDQERPADARSPASALGG
jgi:hypothetical protein